MKGNKPMKSELRIDEKQNLYNHQYVKEKNEVEKTQNENGGCQGEEELAALNKNDLKTWSHQFCHSELQKCHSVTQNYKKATMG